MPARVWQAIWSELMETDLTPDLHRSKRRPSTCGANRDEIALEGEQEILRAAIPNARRLTCARGGHAPHREKPQRFAGVVADYMTALD